MPTQGDTAPAAITRVLGFKKLYNFVLWFIFGGALLGFGLARLQYLNEKKFSKGASPGEWYWYRHGHMHVGIFLHLAGCLPAAVLVPWQFVPNIRYKRIIFHRINGYTIITLMIASIAGALMIARRAFGGSVDIQTSIYVLAVLVLTAFGMAIYNIKRLQIDQHRKWVMRAMFWMSAIITVRIVMVIGAQIVSAMGGIYTVWACDEIRFTLHNTTSFAESFPLCANGTLGPYDRLPVLANFGGNNVNIGSSLRSCFGMATWFAILLHGAGLEIYFALTKDETERLRRVSYERQLKAGFKNPGSSGITSDRWGDSSWVHPQVEANDKQENALAKLSDPGSSLPNIAK